MQQKTVYISFIKGIYEYHRDLGNHPEHPINDKAKASKHYRPFCEYSVASDIPLQSNTHNQENNHSLVLPSPQVCGLRAVYLTASISPHAVSPQTEGRLRSALEQQTRPH